jgi:hypothetical protein
MGAYLVLYPHSRVLMLFPFPVFLFSCPPSSSWRSGSGPVLNGINQLPIFERNAISGASPSGHT